MRVESLDRRNNLPGGLAEMGINSAAGFPCRVMVTRDFSFRTFSTTPRHVAWNLVVEMSMIRPWSQCSHFSRDFLPFLFPTASFSAPIEAS